jgi:hypothetical protein
MPSLAPPVIRTRRLASLILLTLASACGTAPTDDALPPESSVVLHGNLPGAETVELVLGRGMTNALVEGSLAAGQSAEFLLGEEEGSFLAVHLMTADEADAGTVSVRRMDTGELLEDLQPNPAFFEARIPATVGYKLTVTGGEVDTDYVLEVEVPRDLHLDRRGAEISGWLAGWAPVTYLVEGTAGRTLEAQLTGAPAGAHLTLHALGDGAEVHGSRAGIRSIATALTDTAYLLRVHGGEAGGEFTLTATLQ